MFTTTYRAPVLARQHAMGAVNLAVPQRREVRRISGGVHWAIHAVFLEEDATFCTQALTRLSHGTPVLRYWNTRREFYSLIVYRMKEYYSWIVSRMKEFYSWIVSTARIYISASEHRCFYKMLFQFWWHDLLMQTTTVLLLNCFYDIISRHMKTGVL